MDINIYFEYIFNLYQKLPYYVYEGLVSLFVLGLFLLVALYGFKKGVRYSCRLLLIQYVFVLICSTVIFRPYNEKQKHNFCPFWSYEAIHEGRSQLLPENVMNVVAFVPVGLLLGCAFSNMAWWKVMLVGCGISVSIEAMQFYFKRGFTETDDVMHNLLGCLIGYFLVKGILCKVKNF